MLRTFDKRKSDNILPTTIESNKKMREKKNNLCIEQDKASQVYKDSCTWARGRVNPQKVCCTQPYPEFCKRLFARPMTTRSHGHKNNNSNQLCQGSPQVIAYNKRESKGVLVQLFHCFNWQVETFIYKFKEASNND